MWKSPPPPIGDPCTGRAVGGWLLGRRPVHLHWLGIEHYEITASGGVPSGRRNIHFEFAYDGGKPGSGGTGRISVDGAHVAEGRIARTQPFMFSADEGADVGEDLATPVSEEYRVPATFSGTIHRVTIEVQPIAAADRSAVDQAAIEGLQKRAEFD